MIKKRILVSILIALLVPFLFWLAGNDFMRDVPTAICVIWMLFVLVAAYTSPWWW